MSTNSMTTTRVVPGRNPFDLSDDVAYRHWRALKLADYPRTTDDLLLPIRDAFNVRIDERRGLLDRLAKANMAIYQLPLPAAEKRLVRQLGHQLGLQHLDCNLCADEDGISALRVVEKRRLGEYIPYTNKRLNWHTDGYYNAPDRQVRGVILHCVQPAEQGGENALMDHEMAYIQLRDENPAFIRSLMSVDAMTIPANVQDGEELRTQQSGPVFSVGPGGHLHMRYSARPRNIVWRDDSTTRAAAEYLLNLFQADSPYIFRHRLQAGQGVISNNVLHCRTEFSHDANPNQGRLLYRARYFDRVADVSRGE